MKNLLILVISVIAMTYCNAQTDYFPPTNSDEWETLPIDSLNWCQDKVDAMVNFVGDNNSKAFIILKDGKIVVEEYYGTFTQDSSWYWASAGKTLTAFLVGLAQDQGFLDINNPSSDYLGEGWTSLTPQQEAEITVRNQLTMTSGLDYTGEQDCTDPECFTFLNPPGENWYYHNGPYTRLDGVLENATGSNLNLYVFNQLTAFAGISGAYFPVGYNNVFFSKPRSMARFGHLLLNEGVWDGLTLLNDNDYFQSMTTPSQELNEAYGYLTWLNSEDTFMIPSTEFVFPGNIMPNAPAEVYSAQGKNGQILNVVPSQGLVIVRMGNVADEGGLISVLFNDLIWEYINDLECEPMSVAEVSKEQITIYPNPANGIVNIETAFDSEFSVALIDRTGRMVMEATNQHQLDVSSLSGGIYALQITSGREVYSRKLFVW